MKEVILLILTGALSGSIPWLFVIKSKRKKAIAEVVSFEIENARKVVELWKGLANEFIQKQTILETKINTLETKIVALETKICLKTDCKNRIK